MPSFDVPSVSPCRMQEGRLSIKSSGSRAQRTRSSTPHSLNLRPISWQLTRTQGPEQDDKHQLHSFQWKNLARIWRGKEYEHHPTGQAEFSSCLASSKERNSRFEERKWEFALACEVAEKSSKDAVPQFYPRLASLGLALSGPLNR
jgi:hypothetical protein